jgi:hypothetical protein
MLFHRYKDESVILEEKLKDAKNELASKTLSTPWIQSSKIAKPLRGGGSSYGNQQNDISPASSSPQTSTTIPGYGSAESCKNRVSSMTYLFYLLVSSPRSLQGKRSSWYVSLLKK